MTPKELLHAMADEKPVQHRSENGWLDLTWVGALAVLNPCDFNPNDWRLKPTLQKKRVPFGPKNVKPWSIVRREGMAIWAMIVRVDNERIHVGAGEHGMTWKDLMDDGWEISNDGGFTWMPCSEEVDE